MPATQQNDNRPHGPSWVSLEEKDIPGSTNDVLCLLYWPHEDVGGGNHPGEHWVHRVHRTDTYEVTLDNAHYWGDNARKRALRDFNERLATYRKQLHHVARITGTVEDAGGTHYPLDTFVDIPLTDYDGHGFYATETHVTDSLVELDDIDPRWSHVIWHNR